MLLTALSAIAAPSASTLQNLCTFMVRVPALGAAMAESAVSNFDRLSWAWGALLKFSTNMWRMRGVFTCRVRHALDARWALGCDLSTVLLILLHKKIYTISNLMKSFLFVYKYIKAKKYRANWIKCIQYKNVHYSSVFMCSTLCIDKTIELPDWNLSCLRRITANHVDL